MFLDNFHWCLVVRSNLVATKNYEIWWFFVEFLFPLLLFIACEHVSIFTMWPSITNSIVYLFIISGVECYTAPIEQSIRKFQNVLKFIFGYIRLFILKQRKVTVKMCWSKIVVREFCTWYLRPQGNLTKMNTAHVSPPKWYCVHFCSMLLSWLRYLLGASQNGRQWEYDMDESSESDWIETHFRLFALFSFFFIFVIMINRTIDENISVFLNWR